MRIALCTLNMEQHDAVSNDVLGMYHAFCEERFDCRVFAENSFIDSVPVKQAETLADYLRDSGDILIYHHSVGWDMGLDIIRSLKCRKVIKYHNVTPSKFFKGIAENYFAACKAGREHLAKIVRLRVDLFLAASAYNLREILDMALCRIEGAVVPPFHKIDQLQRIEADQRVLTHFGDGNANFLMVGRIVPNKGLEDLIEVFRVYHRGYNLQSRLLIVGKIHPTLQPYLKTLKRKVKKYRLSKSIVFMGEVSAEELKACYQVSSAFTTTSLHEGFCVPLVEAMSMELPIVAYASSAIPETAGEVGFVWEERDSELMAATLNMIVEDEVVRYGLGKMGKRRYQDCFDNTKIKTRMFSALAKAGLIRKEMPFA